MRHLQNTIVVLALSLLTAAAVYGGVEVVGGTAFGSAVTASAASVQTCPATGCTASSCHATTGASPYATSGDAADTGTDTASVLTCPATGCTASSCHATSGGGRGAGNRWGRQDTGVQPELGDALSL